MNSVKILVRLGRCVSRIAKCCFGLSCLVVWGWQVCSAEALRFEHDAFSQLTKVTDVTNVYFECRHDTAGNLLWLADCGVTNVCRTNSLNQHTMVSNNFGIVTDIIYDRAGNTTRIGPNRHSWDADNRLRILGPLTPVNGALVVQNEYDYLGRRIKKTVLTMKNVPAPQVLPDYDVVSATSFVYDNCRLAHEETTLSNGQKQEIQYFWGPDLSGKLDGAGGIGGLLSVSIGGQFHFWCSTKYYDEEMALYDFGNRYYSPFPQGTSHLKRVY